MKITKVALSAFIVLCMAVTGPILAQDSELVDNFEWASGIDASAYYDSLRAMGWAPRESGDTPEARHPDITISTDAKEGEYCLEITEQRSDADYVKFAYEDIAAGYGDWTEYNYLSFWVKASSVIEASTGAVKVYTRDFSEGWGKLDPITVGTEWTFIVYQLPEDKTTVDSLIYFRIFCRGDQGIELPWKLWVDDIRVSKKDPRGPSMLVDDFEWGSTVVPDDEVDSLRAHDWKTRIAEYDSTTSEWMIYPDYALTDDAYMGKRAMELIAVREDYDYVKYNYEYTDSNGVEHFQDLSQYNYISFYMKGDSIISDDTDVAKVYLRDAVSSWIKYDTLPIDTTWQWYVIDLNEKCAPLDRQQVRYIRFHCYHRDGVNLPFSIYLDEIWLTSWDPREPDQPVTAIKSRPLAQSVPNSFELEQNYPNPFNPSTTISFALNQREQVELTIFDLMGRKVRSLVTGTLPGGHHRIVWNGRNSHQKLVPSGVYFYRLETEQASQTRKMLLIK